jgi:capsular polysaccharide transport system permease protein
MTTVDSFEHHTGARGSLFEALRIQRRVIIAVLFRELKTRFWKNKMGYFWVVVEPSLHIILLYLVMTYIRGQTQSSFGLKPIETVASGVIPFFLFRCVMSFVASSILSNQALLKYPLVKIIDLFLARFCLESMTEIAAGIVIFCLLIGVGLIRTPLDLLGIIMSYLATLSLAFGLGTCFAVWSALSNTAWNFILILMMFLYMTSGIFFVGDGLPEAAQRFMSYNPLWNCLELFREAYFGCHKSHFVSVVYPFTWAAVSTTLGLTMVRALRARLIELP